MANEDKRVVKTKETLLEAFFEIAREKCFEDITVNELCLAAGVRRATFYKHFTDKYDFISYATHCLRDKFNRNIWKNVTHVNTKEYFTRYVISLFKFLSDEEILINRILDSEMSNLLINIILEQHTQDTTEILGKSVAMGMTLPAKVETVSQMLTGGIANIVTSWLLSGKKENEEDILSDTTKLIDCILGS